MFLEKGQNHCQMTNGDWQMMIINHAGRVNDHMEKDQCYFQRINDQEGRKGRVSDHRNIIMGYYQIVYTSYTSG